METNWSNGNKESQSNTSHICSRWGIGRILGGKRQLWLRVKSAQIEFFVHQTSKQLNKSMPELWASIVWRLKSWTEDCLSLMKIILKCLHIFVLWLPYICLMVDLDLGNVDRKIRTYLFYSILYSLIQCGYINAPGKTSRKRKRQKATSQQKKKKKSTAVIVESFIEGNFSMFINHKAKSQSEKGENHKTSTTKLEGMETKHTHTTTIYTKRHIHSTHTVRLWSYMMTGTKMCEMNKNLCCCVQAQSQRENKQVFNLKMFTNISHPTFPVPIPLKMHFRHH